MQSDHIQRSQLLLLDDRLGVSLDLRYCLVEVLRSLVKLDLRLLCAVGTPL